MKKAAKGQRKSFWNKYLALSILLLSFGFAHGQAITYTPMTAAGYQFKYLKGDSGLAIPFRNLSTGRGTVRPGSIVCNTVDSLLYYYNGVIWQLIGTGTGGLDSIPNLQQVTDAGDSTTRPMISGDYLAVQGDDSKDNSIWINSPSKGTIATAISIGRNPALIWNLPWHADSSRLYADSADGQTWQMPNASGYLALSVNGQFANVFGDIIDTLSRPDTAWLNSYINNYVTNIIGGPLYITLLEPLRALNDSTEYLDSFYMPQLRYVWATRDTTLWTDSTLVDVAYLNDRLGGIGGGGSNTTATLRLEATVGSTDYYVSPIPGVLIYDTYINSTLGDYAFHVPTPDLFADATLIPANVIYIVHGEGGSNTKTFDASGVATIEGVSTPITLANDETYMIQSDGLEWKVLFHSTNATPDLEAITLVGNTTTNGLFVTDGTLGVFTGLNHQDYYKTFNTVFNEVRWDNITQHTIIQMPDENGTFALLEKLSTTGRLAISPLYEGLMVYDITLHKLYIYDGTTWQAAF